ncbi:hypothetical protein BRADI_1g56332v3 [Brachypodium distachyon]|uniref:OTU domain-containing protein n=1 Tax=Brachypodium distachyon TaxID=15368 RepID=A0A2K2DRQ4_BRADI|nr:hypothetical protein BRADI_1g56332v3 [Brachypodium distachyon]
MEPGSGSGIDPDEKNDPNQEARADEQQSQAQREDPASTTGLPSAAAAEHGGGNVAAASPSPPAPPSAPTIPRSLRRPPLPPHAPTSQRSRRRPPLLLSEVTIDRPRSGWSGVLIRGAHDGEASSSGTAGDDDGKGKKAAETPPPPPPEASLSPPRDERKGKGIAKTPSPENTTEWSPLSSPGTGGREQAKKTFLRKVVDYSKNKVFCRGGINQNSAGPSEIPHVAYETMSTTNASQVLNYYFDRLVNHWHERRKDPVNLMILHKKYSKIRTVEGDGECFYRSFIFSYLEQVIDMKDTYEEQRVLAIAERAAIQHTRYVWASEFPRSHEAFKKLIKKIMRWKSRGRFNFRPSTNSHRKQKLLEFFSTYERTEDIFVFLRLLAAIEICSDREEYEPHIAGLGQNCSLEDWCLRHVTRRREWADIVQMRALASAFEVPLTLLPFDVGDAQPIYICFGVPLARVTLLFTGNHYDILYLGPPKPKEEVDPHAKSQGTLPARAERQALNAQQIFRDQSERQDLDAQNQEILPVQTESQDRDAENQEILPAQTENQVLMQKTKRFR